MYRALCWCSGSQGRILAPVNIGDLSTYVVGTMAGSYGREIGT